MFCACRDKKKNETKFSEIEKIVDVSKEISIDTIFFKNDTILKFNSNSDGYGVFHWGIINQFDSSNKDSLYLDFIDRDIIKIKNSFIYTSSCGSACSYSLIMPIVKNKKGITAMYPLVKNIKSGYLVAKGNEEGVLLSIIDLNNLKIKNVNEEFDETKIPPSLAIDTVYINNSKLSFKWYDKNSKLNFRDIDLSRN